MKILTYFALGLGLTAGAAEVPNDNIAGVGLVLGVEGTNIIVKRIPADSPAAAQKSIHIADWITAVTQDKEPAAQVHGGNLAQAVQLLRGPKGSTVRLTIVPSGEKDSRVQVVSFVVLS